VHGTHSTLLLQGVRAGGSKVAKTLDSRNFDSDHVTVFVAVHPFFFFSWRSNGDSFAILSDFEKISIVAEFVSSVFLKEQRKLISSGAADAVRNCSF